jgi:hypothetical protein
MMQIQTTRGLCGRRRSGVYRFTLSVICMLGVHFQIAWADPSQCEFAGQKQMLMVQLFMGLNPPREGSVNAKAWDAFLSSVVKPRFPDGLTVYDAFGQWRNPRTGSIAKENSKVIVILVADSRGARERISEVADAYKKQFGQLSVGIVSSRTCASF